MFRNLLAFILSVSALTAAELYIDYGTAAPGGNGRRNAPFADIQTALKQACPGDCLRILPSPFPIRDNIHLKDIHGTAEAPIIIDGMNNIFLGTLPLAPSEWVRISPGLYRRHLNIGRNWSSRFFMTFRGMINRMGRIQKASVAGHPYKKPEQLLPEEWTITVGDKLPGETGINPRFATDFFVRIAPGQTLAEAGVEAPRISHPSGVLMEGNVSNILIRNVIVKNFLNDGYNFHNNCTGIRLENIAAIDCGDDAVSAHETCTVNIRNLFASGCSTAICHIQNSTCIHENVYCEHITGRELYLTDNSNVTLKNLYILADSHSGCRWITGRPFHHQRGLVDNLRILYRNSSGEFSEKHAGHTDVRYIDVQIAGTDQIMKRTGIRKVPPENLEPEILREKQRFLRLFKGSLEKAL